ncbi:MAG TPA: methyltransferase [Polyangiales bacterium]|jgi:tRNA1(Val) A37 N6-methylase TrmN6|nr:methyltransferase [Polyangiales bacterium]
MFDDLTDDALTDRVRVWQRRRGHRYSVDDVVTAHVAIHACPDARASLDLGCGIGSVLLMVADRLPHVRATGIEAQDVSLGLAECNIARNQLEARVHLEPGDLRDEALIARVLEREGRFALVTGTPPYKPIGSASASPDSQRAHARVELRGGVEAYLQAAARTLAPEGRFVMCAETALAARIDRAAAANGLSCIERLDVIPMRGRKAHLFSVHTFAFAADGGGPRVSELLLRDEGGARTDASRDVRAFFGLHNQPDEAPSPRLRAAAVGEAR